MLRHGPSRVLVFFLDPIENSSYPVTETGYALMHRAFIRSQWDGDQIFVVYPDATLHYAPRATDGSTQPHVMAHQVEDFSTSPYDYYQSQRDHYDGCSDLGSARCHREAAPTMLCLADVDAIVFRQETGDPIQRNALLHALAQVEEQTVVYLSPSLALNPRLSSKTLPRLIDPQRTPRTFHSDRCAEAASNESKAQAALHFIQNELGNPATVIAKPLMGDNGKGVCVLGQHPIAGQSAAPANHTILIEMLEEYGDLVVQEYVPSVRAPADLPQSQLATVPQERHDFGEIRFILIDGTLPRGKDGQDLLVARRVPTADSLVADSGISYATKLSRDERHFLQTVGRHYVKLGIYFGGGDLIRTPDPQRPFVFTDAARSVCGHAVVTGALNGDPYLIVDQVLDSLERRIAAHTPSKLPIHAVALGEQSSTPYAF